MNRIVNGLRKLPSERAGEVMSRHINQIPDADQWGIFAPIDTHARRVTLGLALPSRPGVSREAYRIPMAMPTTDVIGLWAMDRGSAATIGELFDVLQQLLTSERTESDRDCFETAAANLLQWVLEKARSVPNHSNTYME